MSNHPIELAAAIVIGGVIALVAWLLTDSKVEFSEPTPAPRASMKLTHKELRKMAQDQQIGTSKWRSRAKKSEFVKALQEAR
ncbi:hypothetical protein N9C85_01155 [Synechococcus sp. AH-224-I15]|nr:hypothetical protein [Synechococcus sp. AH-224-I15]